MYSMYMCVCILVYPLKLQADQVRAPKWSAIALICSRFTHKLAPQIPLANWPRSPPFKVPEILFCQFNLKELQIF